MSPIELSWTAKNTLRGKKVILYLFNLSDLHLHLGPGGVIENDHNVDAHAWGLCLSIKAKI